MICKRSWIQEVVDYEFVTGVVFGIFPKWYLFCHMQHLLLVSCYLVIIYWTIYINFMRAVKHWIKSEVLYQEQIYPLRVNFAYPGVNLLNYKLKQTTIISFEKVIVLHWIAVAPYFWCPRRDHLFLAGKTLEISVKTFNFFEITCVWPEKLHNSSKNFGIYKTRNSSYLSWPRAHVRRFG